MTRESGASRKWLAQARDAVRTRLIAARGSDGLWRGRLASSALATATAILTLHRAGGHNELVALGAGWLARTQAADGGWGDTQDSVANLSTTTLSWAALSRLPGNVASTHVVARAAEWLGRALGGPPDPERVARAIEGAYGADRTFSVPILAFCASAGVLGSSDRAWDMVPQLPFELAVLPRGLYNRVGLSVVSYALPALIAIGLVRHRNSASTNPFARAVRGMVSATVLAKLERLQPASGGFLEAAPLTAFVTLSLIEAGERAHPAVGQGVKFLAAGARPDGSWPIDTDLAVWLTTSAVNALGVPPEAAGADASPLAGLDAAACASLRDQLLSLQLAHEHPYTGAAPGGWAWTDHPGGVPDADDTAGAVLALAALGRDHAGAREAAARGLGWLADLANSDGGIPTFCRGWGQLPFDRSAPDLTAHALRAIAAWRGCVPAPLARRLEATTANALGYLGRTQRPDGAWLPLWFGNQSAPAMENPVYGTARVLRALDDAAAAGLRPLPAGGRESARKWLIAAAQHLPEHRTAWGGAPGVTPSIEETALAVEALAGSDVNLSQAGARWLAHAESTGSLDRPAPIGLYFARLWYSEALYPTIFAAAALERAARPPS